jgi:hypothetical protein
MTPKAIAENCELDICEKTVRSRLKSFGLKRRIAAQKEKLTENHIRNRLNFAKNYLNLNFEDWSEFIFTGIIIIRDAQTISRQGVGWGRGLTLIIFKIRGGKLIEFNGQFLAKFQKFC